MDNLQELKRQAHEIERNQKKNVKFERTEPNDSRNTKLLEIYISMIAADKRALLEQFKTINKRIKAKMFDTSSNSLESNLSQNRHKKIVPYDETRVIVTELSDDVTACWIEGHRYEHRYFEGCQQTPELLEIDDFWRMIYETDCKVIVMLTNLIEGGKSVCKKYWPERNKPYKSENYTVKLIKDEKRGEYLVRTFTVVLNSWYSKDVRTVTQYHFVCWPDNGVPQIKNPILRFCNKVMEFAKPKENKPRPVFVYCNYGVGSIGVEEFIPRNNLKEMLNNEEYEEIYQKVFDKNVLMQRLGQLQTIDQLAFLHKLLVETYLLGNTDYSITEFLTLLSNKEKFHKKLVEDFDQLECMSMTNYSRLVKVFDSTGGQKSEDMCVRRYATTQKSYEFPLKLSGSWTKDFSDGRKVISVQTPQSSEIETFLNMILKHSISAVVMIGGKKHQDLYWADEDSGSENFGQVFVQSTSVDEGEYFRTRTITIYSTVQDLPAHTFEQIQVESWKDTDLSEEESRLLCSKLNKLVQQIDAVWNDNSTILIHCKDGSSFCGSLCALLQVNERLKMENKVDLFRVVKDLRDTRPHMVRTINEYEVCHRVAELFIESLHTYAYMK